MLCELTRFALLHQPLFAWWCNVTHPMSVTGLIVVVLLLPTMELVEEKEESTAGVTMPRDAVVTSAMLAAAAREAGDGAMLACVVALVAVAKARTLQVRVRRELVRANMVRAAAVEAILYVVCSSVC